MACSARAHWIAKACAGTPAAAVAIINQIMKGEKEKKIERKQNQIRKIIKRNGKKCLIKLHNLSGGKFLNEQLIKLC